MRFRSMAAWAILAAGTLLAGSAEAFCGFYAGKADASLFNQASQVAMARDGKRTVLTMLNDYRGPLKQFVLVVPTPVLLKQGQISIGDRSVFEHLDAYSSPRLAEYRDENPCKLEFEWGKSFDPVEMVTVTGVRASLRSSQVLGVTVESSFTLGEYDIVMLSAQQSNGLEIWLRENGYHIPRGASAALKPYINQGMKFFVAKVNLKEQTKTGYAGLRPLQFAFESEKFMLPMRLGMLNASPGKPQDLIVYMMTREGRVESSNYRTIKLPANMDIPQFVKPKFTDFYKAMFETEAKREDYRAVFTEYVWNMNWCDPCASQPLTATELLKAGVFWLDDNPERDFGLMQNGTPPVPPAANRRNSTLLTRLHLRYTPGTFPEDLMFARVDDDANWQARYIVHEPVAGSVAACNGSANAMHCEAICKERITKILDPAGNAGNLTFPSETANKSESQLTSECMDSCRATKTRAIDAAVQYYTKELPERAVAEKRNLAELTGWSMHDIESMPGAAGYGGISHVEEQGQVAADTSWWRRLLNNQ